MKLEMNAFRLVLKIFAVIITDYHSQNFNAVRQNLDDF